MGACAHRTCSEEEPEEQLGKLAVAAFLGDEELVGRF